MDKSPRRAPPGHTAQRSGRLKLLLLTLAPLSAGVFAWMQIGLLPEKVSNHSADPTTISSFCLPDDTRTHQSGTPCPPLVARNEITRSNEVTQSRFGQTAVTASSQDTPLIKTSAWHSNDSYATQHAGEQIPRARYTMQELCGTGTNDQGGYGCKMVSRDAIKAPVLNAEGAQDRNQLSISGQVLTTAGIGLPGITVVAAAEGATSRERRAETTRFWTRTDSSGTYSLDGLPAGDYAVRSSASGEYRAGRISARAGVDYADLVVSRDAERKAYGQVVTAAGEPLEGVVVLPLLLGQPSVLTDRSGHFELPLIIDPRMRTVRLRFQRPGFMEESVEAEIRHPASIDTGGTQIVMAPVESWSALSGTVLSDSGDPLAGRSIELKPESAQTAYRTTTDADGRYQFPFLESPADYRLVVTGGSNHKDHQQRITLNGDISELDITVAAYEFGEVSGQLVNLNGAAIPNFDLVIRNTASRKPNALVRTDRHGNFKAPAVPAGELVIASQSTPTILVQGLRLKSGNSLHLPLVLDWGEHEIRGMVVDNNDNPVPASRVVLQWAHQQDGVTTNATRRTATDTQGQFAFNNLGPGPHSIKINAPGHSAVAIDHDLNRQGYNLLVRVN